MNSLYLWWLRAFNIKIDKEEAERLGLTWHKNIYGDAINFYGCRSIWKDKQGRWYFVEELG